MLKKKSTINLDLASDAPGLKKDSLTVQNVALKVTLTLESPVRKTGINLILLSFLFH